MWQLYNELIKEVPINITVDEVIYGPRFVMVRSGDRIGVAMNTSGTSIPPIIKESPIGKSLKEVAAAIKSWNLSEASMGAAALNLYYNDNKKIENLINENRELRFLDNKDTFVAYENKVKDKKVAIIGHFRNISNFTDNIKELYIIEKNPKEGDYPESACEYILPFMDYVFITGSTIINKTLPRLLELSSNAKVILVGPTTPMTPILFKYGVTELSGAVITDTLKCSEIIKECKYSPLVECGKEIRIEKILGGKL
ncbi:DUF364 domain-containing protein [Clostridium gasigenes]|uniref:Rossmann-like domain-containing protein n=1 Tax=Clostridium gasigenes TaxID=94869 RepID=UPI001C0C8676|nr:DUF364 domain-containing protein [Clostridium gasigenes]MBU3135326.1 DUF364 domain-containing protein [Clostridium gasigenes]